MVLILVLWDSCRSWSAVGQLEQHYAAGELAAATGSAHHSCPSAAAAADIDAAPVVIVGMGEVVTAEAASIDRAAAVVVDSVCSAQKALGVSAEVQAHGT